MSLRKLGETTNEYLSRQKKGWLDPEIKELVYALNDTGVVETTYSCEGHFTLGPGSFCHHNQKAQVRFCVKDLAKAATLCQEILSKMLLNDLDVTVQQYVVKGEDDFEIQWSLEYRPVGFWRVSPQDQAVYIAKSPRWTEARARALLRQAFNDTIAVCRKTHQTPRKRVKKTIEQSGDKKKRKPKRS